MQWLLLNVSNVNFNPCFSWTNTIKLALYLRIENTGKCSSFCEDKIKDWNRL